METRATFNLPRFVCLLLLFEGSCVCLTLVEVRIPQYILREHSASLECHFALNGETLYSVKWYKDGHEFYRYIPQERPPAQVFPLPGIAVDVSNSTDSQVVLNNVDLNSSGRYRCEVSGEAPSFQTVTQHGDMIVVALPEEGPVISGAQERYKQGDTVRINCTSNRSRPHALLHWFINGKPAKSSWLEDPEITVTDQQELETAVLGLRLPLDKRLVSAGSDLNIRCVATISTVYWRSSDLRAEVTVPAASPASLGPNLQLTRANEARSTCISLINL